MEKESKTQRRIFASEIDCKKKIDHISCRSKRKIVKLQGDLVLVQSQCHLQSLTIKDTERALLNMKVVHSEEIAAETTKHKHFIQELQRIHETSKFNIRVLFVSGYANMPSIQKNRMTK